MSRCSWHRPPDDEPDDEEADICAICQMPMNDDDAKRAPTSCGRHYFHVGCLCSHYETSRQGGCPVCRKGRRNDPYVDESDNASENASVPARVPFPMVRRAIKANPRTKNMAKTLTKNEKEWKNAKRITKAKEQVLSALQSELEDQIASRVRRVEKASWKRFGKRNKPLIEEVNKLSEEQKKIYRRVLSSQQRMRRCAV